MRKIIFLAIFSCLSAFAGGGASTQTYSDPINFLTSSAIPIDIDSLTSSLDRLLVEFESIDLKNLNREENASVQALFQTKKLGVFAVLSALDACQEDDFMKARVFFEDARAYYKNFSELRRNVENEYFKNVGFLD